MKLLQPLSIVALMFGVVHVAATEPHYLDRYDPVAIWTLNQKPGTEGMSDTSGNLEVQTHGPEPYPAFVDGARDFLGKAWDFYGVDSSFRSEFNGRSVQPRDRAPPGTRRRGRRGETLRSTQPQS